MRERNRKIWVGKEEFSCKKCGASDEDIGWNDRDSDHPKGEPERVFFCKKCGHRLTEKKELEDLLPIVEVQQYGFWLRFVSEHFIPCEKCQEDLDNFFNKKGLIFSKEKMVILSRDYDGIFAFNCAFMMTYHHRKPSVYTLIPCKECQKRLAKIIKNKELHIGNDNKPLVEFWRKWKINDEKTEALQKKKTY